LEDGLPVALDLHRSPEVAARVDRLDALEVGMQALGDGVGVVTVGRVDEAADCGDRVGHGLSTTESAQQQEDDLLGTGVYGSSSFPAPPVSAVRQSGWRGWSNCTSTGSPLMASKA